jgi:hypothetical protein
MANTKPEVLDQSPLGEVVVRKFRRGNMAPQLSRDLGPVVVDQESCNEGS